MGVVAGNGDFMGNVYSNGGVIVAVSDSGVIDGVVTGTSDVDGKLMDSFHRTTRVVTVVSNSSSYIEGDDVRDFIDAVYIGLA